MANTHVRTWYTVVNKVFAITSVILSAAVLISTVYTLSKVNTEGWYNNNNQTSTNLTTDEMKSENGIGKFRSVVNICSSVSLGCAFIQCIISFRTLISCSKKYGVGMKLWLFVHFAAFFLYLAGIIVPLVYYEGKIDSILNPKHFKTVFSKGGMKKFMNAYFAALIANDAFLLVFLITSCLCTRWGHVEKSKKDDQKQKLLSTGKDDLYKY